MRNKDPWDTGALDLEAYWKRLGVDPRTPDRATLDLLHEAHVRAFNFENIDLVLRENPRVNLVSVARKFLDHGRGGYCYEHSQLLAAALERLGYAVRRRLGRNDHAEESRVHMSIEVILDGSRLLADPGLGAGMLRPIEMRDGAQDTYGGMTHRVNRVVEGGTVSWELQRWTRGGWELQHITDELPVRTIDVEMGHHYLTTHPESPLLSVLILTGYLEDGSHVSLTHESVTVRRPGERTTKRNLGEGELGEWLDLFGVPLTGAQLDRLHAAAADLPSTSESLESGTEQADPAAGRETDTRAAM